MTRDDAIEFLREHQPLPPDCDLGRELMVRYNEVRKYFLEYPDADSIPLFLNSFGSGSGFGVYQLIEDVIAKHPGAVVLPHLIEALRNTSGSVRFWSAQIATCFPDASLVEPLMEILANGDSDERWAAACALSFIDDPRVIPAIKEVRDNNSDPEFEDILAGIFDNKTTSEQGRK
jgi:hypothetical protein